MPHKAGEEHGSTRRCDGCTAPTRPGPARPELQILPDLNNDPQLDTSDVSKLPSQWQKEDERRWRAACPILNGSVRPRAARRLKHDAKAVGKPDEVARRIFK